MTAALRTTAHSSSLEGAALPTLKIVSDDGLIIASCICLTVATGSGPATVDDDCAATPATNTRDVTPARTAAPREPRCIGFNVIFIFRAYTPSSDPT